MIATIRGIVNGWTVDFEAGSPDIASMGTVYASTLDEALKTVREYYDNMRSQQAEWQAEHEAVMRRASVPHT